MHYYKNDISLTVLLLGKAMFNSVFQSKQAVGKKKSQKVVRGKKTGKMSGHFQASPFSKDSWKYVKSTVHASKPLSVQCSALKGM